MREKVPSDGDEPNDASVSRLASASASRGAAPCRLGRLLFLASRVARRACRNVEVEVALHDVDRYLVAGLDRAASPIRECSFSTRRWIVLRSGRAEFGIEALPCEEPNSVVRERDLDLLGAQAPRKPVEQQPRDSTS